VQSQQAHVIWGADAKDDDADDDPEVVLDGPAKQSAKTVRDMEMEFLVSSSIQKKSSVPES
jgi:hypothetical protein